MLRLLITILAACVLIPIAACVPKASVVMRKGGTGASVGWLEFEDMGNGEVHIFGNVTGLSPGKHGTHVHTWGDLFGGCESTGPHFNPTNKTHGGPQSDERHVGDLGNIDADAYGVAKVDIYDSVVSLCGENNIIGRGFVVHNGEDDLGLGNFNDSKINGHSGTRFACGTIALANFTSP
ncbi:Superoxide dismutase [Cu-Zn] [Ceratobasidium sp. 423]|nr:Superoxide dismutase [Cu-Zn] [Ceratobasidium sp. 423]